LKKLISNSIKAIYYFFLFFFVLWILYIMVMAGWNTICKGCPVKWYTANVEPILPRPEPKPEPPVIIEEEEEDEDWDDDEETDWR
tara:strand:+ start:6380 stop:6634 length:255 start_codon:yes stop_codon:yes gene_type:complete